MKKLTLLMFVFFAIASCTDKDDDDDDSMNFENTIFTSNNTDGNVQYYTVNSSGDITDGTVVETMSTAADGVYYDSSADEIIQASRSDLGVDVIVDASASISDGTATAETFGAGDMTSPREAAVSGNFIVVADNADADGDDQTLDGRLFIYSRTSSGVSLRNTITTDFKLWGITFIGSDLYAVVDADNELAVFNDFLSNTADATLSASKRVEIEGIVRTHGLTYDSGSNTMIMTDIGSAANTEDDGGFHIIENFTSQFNGATNGGMIAVGSQTRVSGSNTMLGNPVDVAYDGDNDIVYIAEIGNGGGRLLSFNDAKTGGNLQPTSNIAISKVSCVYLNK
ncbi:MAG: hypothetical protein ACPG5B_10795 [Chitinophagales bacterium]